jgi:hypothetical protein
VVSGVPIRSYAHAWIRFAKRFKVRAISSSERVLTLISNDFTHRAPTPSSGARKWPSTLHAVHAPVLHAEGVGALRAP